MPAVSKAQFRWAEAHKKDKGSAGKAAREMIAKTRSTKNLPERMRPMKPETTSR